MINNRAISLRGTSITMEPIRYNVTPALSRDLRHCCSIEPVHFRRYFALTIRIPFVNNCLRISEKIVQQVLHHVLLAERKDVRQLGLGESGLQRRRWRLQSAKRVKRAMQRQRRDRERGARARGGGRVLVVLRPQPRRQQPLEVRRRVAPRTRHELCVAHLHTSRRNY